MRILLDGGAGQATIDTYVDEDEHEYTELVGFQHFDLILEAVTCAVLWSNDKAYRFISVSLSRLNWKRRK